MFGKKSFDMIAIGDTVVDVFIRIKDAAVNCDIDQKNCRISMRFGDKIPFESSEVIAGVGNSANAAVAGSKLGLKTALVADVGSDDNGRLCIDALANAGVNTRFVKMHRDGITNYHYVLWYEDDRTILVKHESYPHELPHLPQVKWLYISSLGQGTENYHDAIMQYIENHPEINVAFQPGTFQLKLGYERLKTLYTRSKVVVMNVEESERLLNLPKSDIKTLLLKLKELGSEIVLITDGPKGAYYYDGKRMLFMPIYPDPKAPVERTGAGDSFAATFVSYLALGLSPEDALLRAPINPMSVVQQVGAQKGLLTKKELDAFLAQAPHDYYPKAI